jgi:hypothetical protein
VPWKLTIRAGPRVEHTRFESLDQALDAVERRARELAESVPREALDVRFKRFEPIEQVVARIELAGPQRRFPSVKAGVDVRGDGSTEAYRGRLTREVIEQQDGEDAFRALRRVLEN